MSVETARSPAISVIVPVRNEAENIAPLVAEIAVALAGRAFEVIYVNDGSTDDTAAELTQLGRSPLAAPGRHARSCGQSAALRTGMAAARAPVIVTLDGDGQNDPAFLPKLVDALVQGAPRMGLIAGPRRKPTRSAPGRAVEWHVLGRDQARRRRTGAAGRQSHARRRMWGWSALSVLRGHDGGR